MGFLTSLIAPWAPLALSVLLSAGFVVWFALHRTVGAAVRLADHTPDAPSPWSGRVLLLAAAMLLVGGVFGSVLTALAEFLRLRGLEGQTGAVYGAMSAGAIVVAIVAAALPVGSRSRPGGSCSRCWG